MQIIAWRDFSKKRNSTKRPVTPGIEIDVFLKEETSIENPSFVLAEPLAEYTYIQAFGHYYFVDDVINLDAYHSEIRCSQDILATFKTEILATTAKVLYSSSNYSLDIKDVRMSTKDTFTSAKTTIKSSIYDTAGCYILTVMNGNNEGAGGIAASYAMEADTLSRLNAEILNAGNSFWTNLKEDFNNPMDAIISCTWIPLSLEAIQLNCRQADIVIGRQNTDITALEITDRLYVADALNVPIVRPEAHAQRTYLRKAPYTTGFYYLPFVGVVEADMDVLYNMDTLTMHIMIDLLTGDIIYTLKGLSSTISTYAGNMQTKVPLSASGFNATGLLSAAVTLIGGAATAAATGGTGIGVAAFVGSTVGGLLQAEKALEIHTQINGAISSCLGVWSGMSTDLVIVAMDAADSVTAIAPVSGLPCAKVLNLGTLTGYCQCENASISLNGRSGDRDAINSFLNGGFYIE